MATIHADNLGQIFQALRSQTHETRLQAAIDLRRYVCLVRLPVIALNAPQVVTTVVEMPSDAAVKLWDDDINKRLFDLMHSQNNAERLGGLLAIGMSYPSVSSSS